MDLYRLLLHLYPVEHQINFADEMLSVFRQAAAEHREKGLLAYAQFLALEFTGLLQGAFRQRRSHVPLTPVFGGVFLAAVIHYCFYSGMFRLMGAVDTALRRASLPATDPLAGPIIISMFGVATLLSLLPLFVFLGSHVRLRRP